MAETEIATRLTHLYAQLHSTAEERGKAALRIEIDRLLAQMQDAARAIEPPPAWGRSEGPRRPI